MLADKSAEAVAVAMGDACKQWFCADSPGPRGQSGERLAQRLKAGFPAAQVSAFGSLADAMQAALSGAGDEDTVLVFGSFTTVSAAADWLINRLQQVGHDADRISVVEAARVTREKTDG
jgi:dihydrofolate synthase/folylpolyglutamate synthase